MFTDQPTTPRRFEVIIELLQLLDQHKEQVDEKQLISLLQPTGLDGVNPNSNQAKITIKALRDLKIIEGNEKLSLSTSGTTGKEALINALEKYVLPSDDIEYYFSKFYAYILGRDENLPLFKDEKVSSLIKEFNKMIFGNAEETKNPFNWDKYKPLLERWWTYVGLGWVTGLTGSKMWFQPNPYERTQRQLSEVFGKDRSLECHIFVKRLGDRCPELDGGSVFNQVNQAWSPKKCSAGLSKALFDLHKASIIELNCPKDSDGYDISSGGIMLDDDKIQSQRFTDIKYLFDRDQA